MRRRARGPWTVSRSTYQWLRDGSEIPGAIERKYMTRRVDRGHKLWVRVSVTADGYHAASQRSAAVSHPVRTRIDPGPTDDQRRSPVWARGCWRPTGRFKPGDAKVTYQWYRDDRAIRGETKRSYVPRKRDVGTRLYVVVTVQAADWAPAAAARCVPTRFATFRSRHGDNETRYAPDPGPPR